MSVIPTFYARLRLLLALLLFPGLLIACSGQSTIQKTPVAAPVDQTRDETLVYECSDIEFVARVNADEMAVWFEGRDLILLRVPSASGEKYESDDVVFWSKGEEAFVEIDNQLFDGCELAPKRVPWEDARRRGVDFRGVGNEPGWTVEIRHDSHILFVGDYGNQRVLMTEPVSSAEGDVSTYTARNDHNEMKVKIVDEPCSDTMADDTFASQVTVTYAGNTYRGCGATLTSDWE
jgi:membrane-bound inhibitor of C-type lysozyme/uncharacterized membrane protein